MSSREQLQTQVDEQFPDLDLYWYEPAPGNWVVAGDSKPLTEDQAKAVVAAYAIVQQIIDPEGPITIQRSTFRRSRETLTMIADTNTIRTAVLAWIHQDLPTGTQSLMNRALAEMLVQRIVRALRSVRRVIEGDQS